MRGRVHGGCTCRTFAPAPRAQPAAVQCVVHLERGDSALPSDDLQQVNLQHQNLCLSWESQARTATACPAAARQVCVRARCDTASRNQALLRQGALASNSPCQHHGLVWGNKKQSHPPGERGRGHGVHAGLHRGCTWCTFEPAPRASAARCRAACRSALGK